jgi:hypothetical protein
MAKPLDDLMKLADLVEVRVRGKAVRLRQPSFGEWHDLAGAHRRLKGEDPPAELVARTVAVCVADDAGGRAYSDADLEVLLAGDPRTLMALYVKCWETVLRNDEQAVRAEEGN